MTTEHSTAPGAGVGTGGSDSDRAGGPVEGDDTASGACYAIAAEKYFERDWSPLPLPPGKKSPPPANWTGEKADYPSWPDVDQWVELHPNGNVGLRLPHSFIGHDGRYYDVIGVDVDNYDGKPGGATLLECEQKWGRLPATWRSSSRPFAPSGIPPSGIYFFRVPEGLWFIGGLPGVDLIAWYHRYAVVWPSLHPEGRTYHWYTEDGLQPDGQIPLPADLPMLPGLWLAGLMRGQYQQSPTVEVVADRDEWLEKLPGYFDPMCDYLKGQTEGVLGDLGIGPSGAVNAASGSRYDTMRSGLWKLVHSAEEGHPGSREALQKVHDGYLAALAATSTRTSEAENEFQRALSGAVDKTDAKPSWPSSSGDPCSSGDRSHLPGASDRSMGHTEGPVSDSDDFDPWEPQDLDAILTGEVATEKPTIMPREDGVCLLYPGRVHSFHGQSESGKSLLAQYVCAGQLQTGSRVLYLDYEDTAVSIVERLRAFGVADDLISTGLVYINPQDAPSGPSWKRLLAQPFSFAVIDGVSDSFAVANLNADSNADIVKWSRGLPRLIARSTGAAVVLVDHVVKNEDAQGRWAIGGQAKMAQLTGPAFKVEVKEAIARGRVGILHVRLAKDRLGYLRAQCGPYRKEDHTQLAAEITVNSRNPDSIVITVGSWTTEEPVENKPTWYMQAISQLLAASETPLSQRQIVNGIGRKERMVRKALVLLIADGYVLRTEPAKSGLPALHSSAIPYVQDAGFFDDEDA